MGRSYAQLLAFNRGEVSKTALSRIDVAKLQLAAECELNWVTTVTGAMSLRAGLEHIGETAGDAAAEFIPFVFSKLDTAQFELTPNSMRIRVDDVLISRVAVSTAVGDGSFAGTGSWVTSDTTAGCTATITGGVATLTALAKGGLGAIKQTLTVAVGDQGKEHGLRVVVSRGPVVVQVGTSDGAQDLVSRATLETGTHSLAFTPQSGSAFVRIESTDARSKMLTSVTIEAAGVVSLPTPWGASDLDNLRWEQSGDVVYVDCDGIQQRRITRRSLTGYGIELYRPENGPFADVAELDMTLAPSVYEGNGTLTASRSYFEASHVGALFRLFTPGQGNSRLLGAAGAYTEAIRVTGVGNDRVFGWTVSGTWAGVLTLQRSLVDAVSGFTDVASTTINGTLSYDDSQPTGDNLDNVVAWYRVGFKAGDYTSGSATVFFGQSVTVAAPVNASLVAANTYSSDLGVVGTGAARSFTVSVTGTFVGTVTLQKSTGPVDIGNVVGNGAVDESITIVDGLSGTVNYRAGFKLGDYTSGTAVISLRQSATGGSGGSSTGGSAALSGGRYGICRVTGYTSPTQVSIEVLEAFSSLNPTNDWVEGSWSDRKGYPSALCISESRLWHFSGERWWGSQSVGFASFGASDKFGQSFGDAAVVTGAFGAGPLGVTNWAVASLRILMGREQSIESGRSSSFDEPITPTAFTVKPCSTDGADRLPALKIDQRVVYVQQSHRRVFELGFSGQALDYVPRDLTRLNTDIGEEGFVSVAAQRQPDPTLQFVRGGGQCASLLYLPAEEIECWLRMQTQGVIERVSILPSDTLEDRVYYIVKRTINGVTKRFIERTALRSDCKGGLLNKQLDSFVSYSGAPVTSMTAAHLPNTFVWVWADGAVIGSGTTDGAGTLVLPDGQSHSNVVMGLAGDVISATSGTLTGTLAVPSRYEGCPAEIFADVGGTGELVRLGTVVVSGNAVTLPGGKTAYTILACLGYVAPFVSAKFGAGVPLGTKRRADHLGLLLYDTHAQGLSIGQRIDVLDDLPAIEAGQEIDPNLVWPEYARHAIEVPGEWSADARLIMLAKAPYPVTVGAAIVSVEP